MTAVIKHQDRLNVSAGKLATTECPYCKTSLQNAVEIVVCSNCRTMHHTACWIENNSQCSIFGCDNSISTQFLIYRRHPLITVIYYLGMLLLPVAAYFLLSPTSADLLTPLLLVFAWGAWVALFQFITNFFAYCPRCRARVNMSRDRVRLSTPESCPNCGLPFLL